MGNLEDLLVYGGAMIAFCVILKAFSTPSVPTPGAPTPTPTPSPQRPGTPIPVP